MAFINTIGRPAIGPKAQTHIPEEEYAEIEAEAQRRGVRPSVVLREVIREGIRARYAQEAS